MAYLLFVLSFVTSVGYGGELIRMRNETLRLAPVPLAQAAGGNKSFTNAVTPRFLPTFGRVYYIIQFEGPVHEEWKQVLKKAKVELGSYLPDDAYLVRVNSPSAWKAINSLKAIRAVSPYKTSLRVSHEFQNIVALDGSAEKQKVVIRLAFADEGNNVLRVANQRGISFVINQASEKNIVVETTPSEAQKLADIEGVEWVEPLAEIKLMDFDVSGDVVDPMKMNTPGDYSDLTGYESGTKLMNFDSAYARGLHGEGETVGIADTGVDRGSLTELLDDFKGSLVKGYALGLFSKSWQDPQGHGTHTSGSISGTGAQSGNKLHGGAPASKLVIQSLWSPMLKNISIVPDFDKIFGVLRRDDDVHIHSNSWGSPKNPGTYDSLAVQVDELSWRYPDLLIIFAAGNEGEDANKDGRIDSNSIGTPATAKNCLTVGASKNLVAVGGIQKAMKDLRDGDKKWGVEPLASSKLSDNPMGLAAFSSRGPTVDGRIKPEIVAPGTNIISDRSQNDQATPLWGAYNQVYAYAGGTSMSTPLTAGAAAVIRQYLKGLGRDPSAALIKAVLLHTATDLFPGGFGTGAGQELLTTRPNSDEGFGRVDVGSGTDLSGVSLNDEKGLKTGETKQYNLDVKKGATVRATLVYTDAPAAVSAAKTLVNDLDLTVSDPDGKAYFPNHLSGPDRVNNSEMIEFTAPRSGVYKVTVEAHSVPKGRDDTGAQPYALVMK